MANLGTLPKAGLLLIASLLLATPELALAGGVDGKPHKPIKPPPPPPPDLVDLTEVSRVTPYDGFIELMTVSDGAGLLAYVQADAATRAAVHVIDVSTGAEVRTFDIAGLTTTPHRLWFVGKGAKASIFVVGAALAGEGIVGGLYDATGKIAKKTYGPAPVVTLIERKGKPLVAVRTVSTGKKGGEVYSLELFDPKKGKRIGKARKLTLTNGRDDKLGFTLNHWADDGLTAVGIKDGAWSKKSNARTPDAEGRYDLTTGKMQKVAVADLIDHKRRFDQLARSGGAAVFARVSEDVTGIELWRDEKPVVLELSEPFNLYNPDSLTWAIGDAGSAWIGLTVDPWNRPAVDRKRADSEYFDIFKVDAAGKAARVGRVLASKKRLAIGAAGGKLFVLDRNIGFDRGAKALILLQP